MITVPELAAEALGSFLASEMNRRFESSPAHLTELVPSMARLALECIGNSDALYHNVEHTMLVTLAGHDIMKGRALLVPTLPTDYAHLIVSCLMHDIEASPTRLKLYMVLFRTCRRELQAHSPTGPCSVFRTCSLPRGGRGVFFFALS